MTLFLQTPICGFADVRFHVLWGDDPTAMPGWEQESHVSTVKIPGGNRSETFLMGLGPLRATYAIELESRANYTALALLQQTQGTLTLYEAVCEFGERQVVIAGRTYTEIDDVTLLSVSRPNISPDGPVTCTATFQLEERPSW